MKEMKKSVMVVGHALGSMVVFGLLVACNLGGSSVLTHKESPAKTAADNASNSTQLRSAVQVQALAIGQQVISNLGRDIGSMGLTEPQTQVITASAERELLTHVSTLALPDAGFTLASSTDDEYDPIYLASPSIISGAMAAVDDPGANQDSGAARAALAKTIMTSTVSSLNSRTGGLSEESVGKLAKEMVASAVSRLADAGMQGEYLSEGSKAITEGAIGSLGQAGIASSNLNNVAASMMTAAVASLANVNLGSDAAASSQLLSEAIGKATQGAVASIGKISSGSAQSLSLVSSLTSSSVNALGDLQKGLQKNGASSLNLATAVKKVSENAVASLSKTDLAGDQLGTALQTVASSMVTSLEKAGFDKNTYAQGASAVAAGSLVGFAAAGLSEAEIAAKGLVKEVMSGTIKSMGSASLSARERATAVGDIVATAVAAIGAAGLSSSSAKGSAVNSVLEGTMASFKEAGLSDASVAASAITNASKGATKGLQGAGFSEAQMGSISGSIAKTSITMIASAKLNTSAEDFQTLASKVTLGVMEGLGALQKSGAVSETTLNSGAVNVVSQAITALSNAKAAAPTSLGSLALAEASSLLVSSSFVGLATGGVSATTLGSLSSQVSTQMSSDLRQAGVEESKITAVVSEVSSEAAKAQTLAQNLGDAEKSFAVCSDGYADGDSDATMLAKLEGLADPVFCLSSTADLCPKDRSVKDGLDLEWDPSDLPTKSSKYPYLCQLHRTLKEPPLPGSFDLVGVNNTYAEPAPTFSWSAAEGASYYRIEIAAESSCAIPLWQDRVEGRLNARTPALAEGNYYICLRAFNRYGRVLPASSSPRAFAIKFLVPPPPSLPPVANDSTPPQNVSVRINNNAVSTSASAVTLAVFGDDATHMIVSETADCAGTWESINPSKPWSLTQGNALNYVYAKFKDAAGNMSACVSDSIFFDATAPTISHITAADGTYTSGQTLDITVHFTEAVTISAGSSVILALSPSPASAAFVQLNAARTEAVYRFIVAAGSAADLNATGFMGTITDDAGHTVSNPAVPVVGSGHSLQDRANIVVGPATIVSVSAANGAYSPGQTVPITVTFSRPVTVSGTVNLSLISGATVSCAGANTTALSCPYVVGAGHTALDLDYSSATSLALGGGALVRDQANADADLNLPAPGSLGSLAYSSNVSVGPQPSVLKVYSDKDSDGILGEAEYYKENDALYIYVDFSQPVTVSGTPRLNLNGGLVASFSASHDTDTLKFTYTVAANSDAVDLGYQAGATIDLNGGAIVSAFGIPVDTSLPSSAGSNSLQGSSFIILDTTPPAMTVSISSPYQPQAMVNLSLTGSQVEFDQMDLSSRQVFAGLGCTGSPISASWGAVSAGVMPVSNIALPISQMDVSFSISDLAGNQACLNSATPIQRRPAMPSNVNDGGFAPAKRRAPHISWTVPGNTTNIFRYEIAIGTSQGSDNHFTWFTPGPLNDANAASYNLSQDVVPDLSENVVYYTSIRACDSDSPAHCSEPAYGDGFTFKLHHRAYVKAPNLIMGSKHFGKSLAMMSRIDSYLVVGAPSEDSNQDTISSGAGALTTDDSIEDSGAVYVYKRSGNAPWERMAYVKAPYNKLESGIPVVTGFGAAVDIAWNPAAVAQVLAVGAIGDSTDFIGINNIDPAATLNRNAASSGAVYIYNRQGEGGPWQWDRQIKAPNGAANDRFGSAVSLHNDWLAVGAPQVIDDETTITQMGATVPTRNDPGGAYDIGAVYVYRRNGFWQQPGYIRPSTLENGQAFGTSLDISNGPTVTVSAYAHNIFLAVGSPGKNAYDGAVYTYKYSPSNGWSELATPLPGTGSERLGQAVAFSQIGGDLFLAMGAPSFDNAKGKVKVFKLDPGTPSWVSVADLQASNPQDFSYFGESLAFDGNQLVVGAYGDPYDGTSIKYNAWAVGDTNALGSMRGAAYHFTWNGSSFVQKALIKSFNGANNDSFGSAVAVLASANPDISSVAAIGAYQENGTYRQGADDDPFAGITDLTTFTDSNNYFNSGAVYIYQGF